MIINKTIKIKNKPYYINKGYDKYKNLIDVKIEDLRPNSNYIIRVKCDICGNEKELKYCKYTKNTKMGTVLYACSHKCSVGKLMNTFNERFGCVSSQHPDIKSKQSKTMMEKYGGKSPLCSKIIKEKSKETIRKNYGVDNVSKNDKIKYKKTQTTLKNWNVKNPSQSEQIKNKKIKTTLKNYGVENPLQNKNIRKKGKNTKFKKYGNENYNNRCKSVETCLIKYGVNNVSQDEIINLKKQKSLFLRKKFKNLTYQGTYELDFLEKYQNLNIEKGKTIRYKFENKEKIYFSDFFYKPFNLIIEIKSDYIYKKDIEKNLIKQKSCIEQGYNFIFIINKNYEDFNILLRTLTIQ